MTIANNKEFSSSDIELALDRISDEIATNHRDTAELFLVGIAEGGVPMARRLAAKISENLDRKILHGVVDVSFHRDDIGSKPIPKISSPTEIPEIVDGGTCVLVDDVIHTGRSTRAALNELFDQGRLGRIELAVLVDRGNRKLPAVCYQWLFSLRSSIDKSVPRFEISHGPSGNVVDIGEITRL